MRIKACLRLNYGAKKILYEGQESNQPNNLRTNGKPDTTSMGPRTKYSLTAPVYEPGPTQPGPDQCIALEGFMTTNGKIQIHGSCHGAAKWQLRLQIPPQESIIASYAWIAAIDSIGCYSCPLCNGPCIMTLWV